MIDSFLEDEPAEQQSQANDVKESKIGEISSDSLIQNGMTFFSQLVNTLTSSNL